ncbi:hypothetical protein F5Y18DRAFT_427923 [Xylariaceae sp. FL1019]|nr:hypothetical protein F5Y18DRAFT_427923 [Xylariaceae sp. FL1019]
MKFLASILLGVHAIGGALATTVPPQFQNSPQGPMYTAPQVNNSDYIYIRCIRGEDEPGYVSYYRDERTDDFRRFAIWVPEAEKEENAFIFTVITQPKGIVWLQGNRRNSNPEGGFVGDRPLHFGKDFVDFEDTHTQTEWDLWIKPNGRMKFDTGGHDVYISKGGRADGRLNLIESGDPAYFYAEPAPKP